MLVRESRGDDEILRVVPDTVMNLGPPASLGGTAVSLVE